MSVKIADLLNNNKLVKLFEILLLLVLGLFFILIFEYNKGDDVIYNQVILWLANIFLLLYVFLGIKLRGDKIGSIGLCFKKFNLQLGAKSLWQSIVVFVLALLFFTVGTVIMANITGIPEGSDTANFGFIKMDIWILILTLIGVYIASSFGEEVIYRGFLMNRLSELGLNKHMTVVISAGIFGIIHYGWGPMGIVQTGLMGIALGYSYIILKKRLWVLILAHMYLDTLLLLFV